MIHPTNKLERLKLGEKKAKRRLNKYRRKHHNETKEQEAADEVRSYEADGAL